MTDTMQNSATPFGVVRVGAIATLAAVAFAVGGCGTSGNILDSLGPVASGTAPTSVATAPAAPTKKRVAFAPLIGAPAAISQQLSTSVASEVGQRSVPVVQSGAPTDYTVRGYVVAAPDQSGTKLSYIWDVTDPAGKRAHRITGEEFVKGRSGGDPWANVTPTVLNGIATKTATQLAAWVPSAVPAAANAVGGPAPTPAASSPVPLTASAARPAASAAVQPTALKTASAKPASLPALAMIPPVTGAPGDGKKSLSAALKRNLQSRGVSLTTKPSAQTYTVRGNVAMGKAAAGKQDIEIQWLVFDPKGQRVGTVAQKNKIPQGSLDGAWGKTADAAAAAAGQGVAKLLPKTVKVN
ncbi:MAG: hypothetical protein AAFZ01_05345 [Pseudomonadota bacterium]